MRWDVQSLVGLVPIKLGMKRVDVAKLLDPIEAVTAFLTEHDGSRREFRGLAMPVISYRGDVVLGVDTSRHVANVIFRDLDIYNTPPIQVLQALEAENGGAVEAVGLIVFENLGISCSGFFSPKNKSYFSLGSGEQDDRGLGIFEEGAFSPYQAMFQDITFAEP